MKRIMTLGTTTEMTLKTAFEEFLRVKKVKNLAKATLDSYEDDYKSLCTYIDSTTLCATVNSKTVFAYLEALKENKPYLSPVTINTYLCGIRTFFYFCMEQGYMPNFKISLIHAEKQLKEVYTDAELERLLKRPNVKKSSFAQYRNWVLICYLLGTGNRRTTVCNVKIGDVDFDSREIRLRMVKNKRQYTIPISGFLEKTLREYLTYRKGDPEDYLFCNAYGHQLTLEGLKTCVQKYNTSCGVPKTGLHLFRHTFAKKWILNGGDPFRLKAILGHSTMAMVNEYVNMYGRDLQKDFDRFSPLDNLECVQRSTGHIKMER